MGGHAATDAHKQVGLGGHDAIEREHGHTALADLVILLLIGQRAAQAGLDGFKVDLVATHVASVDGLNLAQLLGQDGPSGHE